MSHSVELLASGTWAEDFRPSYIVPTITEVSDIVEMVVVDSDDNLIISDSDVVSEQAYPIEWDGNDIFAVAFYSDESFSVSFNFTEF